MEFVESNIRKLEKLVIEIKNGNDNVMYYVDLLAKGTIVESSIDIGSFNKMLNEGVLFKFNHLIIKYDTNIETDNETPDERWSRKILFYQPFEYGMYSYHNMAWKTNFPNRFELIPDNETYFLCRVPKNLGLVKPPENSVVAVRIPRKSTVRYEFSYVEQKSE